MYLLTLNLCGKNILFCGLGTLISIHALTIQTVVGHGVPGDFFTSLHKMEALAHQEHRLLNTVNDYISTQKEKLKLLNFKLEQYSKFRSPKQDVDPFYTYHLVRRLTREWSLILNLIIHNISIGENILDEISSLPNEENLTSAAKAFLRLQDVYKLNSRQLAQEKGNLANLTAMDCYEMGKYLLKINKYELAATWFKEAVEKDNDEEKIVIENTITPHLVVAQLLSGYYDATRSGGATKVLQDLLDSFKEEIIHDRSQNPKYSEACRGINVKNPLDLKCFYIHYNNPRLLIAPFKMEEINIDPPILMFHGVVSDQEVEEMKTAFKKVKEPCTTKNPTNPYYRTCDRGWVTDYATPASARLTRRVGDMTNLQIETSEDNQVASYGLGGAYLLHYDAIPSEHFAKDPKGFGGRLATLMYYLNDVEEGGFTVFPLINVAVKPVKGSAVLWYNIDHRGFILPTLYHGGCPILRGSKWVLNKWIHEAKQKRPDMLCPADMKFPKPRYYMSDIYKNIR